MFIHQIGREAMIEKKKARNAHYRREASPDLELDDNALLGGDDFRSRYLHLDIISFISILPSEMSFDSYPMPITD